jgi:hypothetical protein
MTPRLRRTVLVLTALIGVYVGGWAVLAPHDFYRSFPGFGLIWVAIDGPWNEHLVRDVGALYLGLAAATAYGAVQHGAAAVAVSRAVGLAWVVFSLPHLGYHLLHLGSLAPLDVVLQVVSLSSTVLLGALLMLGASHSAPLSGRAVEHTER